MSPRLVIAAVVSVLLALAPTGRASAQSCTPDPFEQDDACSAATVGLGGGSIQSRDFCDDAEDWLVFHACAGRSYTIRTSGLGPLADTVLEIHDPSCLGPLALDDNGGGGLASRIDWSPTSDGVYRVRVRQADASFGADRGYDVSLTGDTAPCSTWARNYGTSQREEADFAEPTADGGFVVLGSVDGDLVVLKLDSTGAVQWQKRLGGSGYELRRRSGRSREEATSCWPQPSRSGRAGSMSGS